MPIFRRKRIPDPGPHDGLLASDQVWNRAVMDQGGATPADGDRALSALMDIHGIAMNGGLLHSMQSHDARQIRRAIDGYRYFGLHDAAAAVEWAQQAAVQVQATADEDVAEQLECETDDRYATAVPDDEVLVAAFEARFRAYPTDFAPL